MKAAVEATFDHVLMLGEAFGDEAEMICSVVCRAYKNPTRVSYQIIDDEGKPISGEHFITDNAGSAVEAAAEEAKATLKKGEWLSVDSYMGVDSYMDIA